MLLVRRLFIQTRQLQCASVSIHHAMRAASSSAAAHHPRIAVIGSGPSGLYVCARLLQKLPNCRIDVFDKAQAPFGLIYYGVAPDHLDMKKSMNSFERMFTENRERLELFCNVDINRDVTYQELCATYEAVVLAYGASKARGLGLPNEQAPNCFSGLAFVSWYNGVPQFTPGPQLDQEEAVVVGNGNVAIDCSRILLSSPQRLAQTDITEQALRALKKSRVRNIRVLGRRGPKEVSFTIKELRELLGLEGVDSYCAIEGPQAEQLRQDMAKMERPRRRLMELMLAYASGERAEKQKIGFPDQKRLQLQFHRQPVAIGVDSSSRGGRVSSLRVRHSLTGEEEEIPCGLLIYAIGFENVLLAGLPRTEEGRLKMLDWCRVPDDQAAVYATGWCSHAARGLIADSQQQAYSVADQIAEDWVQRRIATKPTAAGDGNSREHILKKLQAKGVNYVSWDDWRHIDECERRMGALLGKTREKLTDVTTMLRIMRHGA